MKKYSEKSKSSNIKKFKRFGNKEENRPEMRKINRENKKSRKKEKLKKNYNKINFQKKKGKKKYVNDPEEYEEDSLDYDFSQQFQTNIIRKEEVVKERKRESVSCKIPWISVVTKEAVGLVKLHNEIGEFYEFIKPKSDQNQLRMDTFNMFRKLIKFSFPNWSADLFGSFPLNVHLPNSDIDIMVKPADIASQGQEREILQYIYIWIMGKNFAEDIEMVDAKTPIIRMKCVKTKIRMDVCVTCENTEKGHASTSKFSSILEKIPSLKPIVMLIKFVLRQRNLNETYTGGVGSYLLLNMTYAYSQYLKKIGEEEKIFNLGQFFMGFLKFYGEEFNYKELGISINNRGEFFRKRDRSFFSYNNTNLLCFENYQDTDIDIGKGAYQFPKVKQLFSDILHTLYKSKVNTESFLVSFINVTTEMMRKKENESKRAHPSSTISTDGSSINSYTSNSLTSTNSANNINVIKLN